MADSLEIIWDKTTLPEWEALLVRCGKSPLTQAYPYGRTRLLQSALRPHFGVIYWHGEKKGIIQLLQANIFGLYGITKLERGPLWFEDEPSAEMQIALFKRLASAQPAKFGTRFNLLPEMADRQESADILQKAGLRPLKKRGYQTFWLDISPDIASLKTGLKPNWRNKLNKVEKQNLRLEIDRNGTHLNAILKHYAIERWQKNFAGPSPRFIRNFAKSCKQNKTPLTLYLAYAPKDSPHDNMPIAAVAMATHGRAATYFIGWNGEIGRNYNAHHFLLWQAIKDLKSQDIHWLDLGGINKKTAAGVTNFKAGLDKNFTPSTTIGAYGL